MSERSRKFTIKPFRTYVQMDEAGARRIWSDLASAIDEIHNRNASSLSFEELYRNAYNLVLHKHGALLYDGVESKLTSHLLDTVNRLGESEDETLLEEVSTAWSEHRVTMVMVRDILMYMDRVYVQQNRQRPVYELGLHLFRVTVWEHPRVRSRASDLLLQAIASERAGLLTDDRTLLRSVLGMLLELGSADGSDVYGRDFERPFLGTTQEFYRLESLDYLGRNSASDYVRKARSRIEEEKARAAALGLAPATEAPLQSIVETELIERHAETLVKMENSGFSALLRDETKGDELRDMYDLFARVPGSVSHLRDALAERVRDDGRQLVADQERGAADPPALVRGVLRMRERYGGVVEQALRAEKRAARRLRESFEDFLNADARAASCLAVYVDELLRSGLRGASESEVDAALNKVIVVFRYLSDKDVFEAFYKQHLARRLLGGRSVSDEAERAMVSQLKAECGYQFTSKLEGMFNDMRIGRDTRDAYKQHKKALAQQPGGGASCNGSSSGTNSASDDGGGDRPVDVEVDVLTAGYWPSQNVPPCTLPAPVQVAIKRFSDFYLQKHTGRKLSWQTSTGTAEMRATFGSGKGHDKFRRHDLSVSTYQMCILVLFNDSATLTLQRIRELTGVPDAELRRHLISLCTPRHRVLRKASKGKAIAGDDDSFSFNADFTSKLKRVRIPLVSMKETGGAGAGAGASGSGLKSGDGVGSSAASGGDGAAGLSAAVAAGTAGAIPAPVEEDRRHLVEAAIVRIMKARKALHHNDLIAEVTRQLSVRFVPSPQFIKKRVESLIEREYLERDEGDRRVYVYVA